MGKNVHMFTRKAPNDFLEWGTLEKLSKKISNKKHRVQICNCQLH